MIEDNINNETEFETKLETEIDVATKTDDCPSFNAPKSNLSTHPLASQDSDHKTSNLSPKTKSKGTKAKSKHSINPTKVIDIANRSDKSDDARIRVINKKMNTLSLLQKKLYVLRLSDADKALIKSYNNERKEVVETKKAHFDKQHIFEIKDFSLWYLNGKKQALTNLNTAIVKNKVTAFIGPSGCGKSTFLRMLNRMNDLIPNVITEGDIWFKGVHLSSKKLSTLELRTRVGLVFQKATPFEMTIYENVAYGPKSHGIKDKKALDAIVEKALIDAALWDEVKDELDRMGTDLSGGQQQRLCIARTIALEPEVILMDEPTSALDPIATNKIEQLIKKLREKYTIVIVTHSMAQAQRVSDRTIFFYEGRIIEEGPTKQIFTRPEMKRTKDYISGRIG